MTKLKTVFMGTPDFAVATLKALHHSGHFLPLVVTQPDRPKGRGRKLTPTPVKKTALELGCDVLQPQSVRSGEFLEKLKHVAPDVVVVVAYGQLLPEEVLSIPRLGAINIHASLLPCYRGPAPIQWAIINGETVTGVTTMMLDQGMDTGDILLTAPVPIEPSDTAATLHDRLAKAGALLLLQTLAGVEDGSVQSLEQDHSRATYAPLLKKADGRVDWTRPAGKLECFIRGMTPWPGAFTFRDQQRLKLLKARSLDIESNQKPGTVVERFSNELCVATGNGVLSIIEIQGASGKRMSIEIFLRGNPMPPGTRFE